ncbi:MAG: hypothetical protein AAFQ42_00980 [Pseudomonadota bacterium]
MAQQERCSWCSGLGYKQVSRDVTCQACGGRGSGYAEGHFTCHGCFGSGRVTRLVDEMCSVCGGKGQRAGAQRTGSRSARRSSLRTVSVGIAAMAYVVGGFLAIGVLNPASANESEEGWRSFAALALLGSVLFSLVRWRDEIWQALSTLLLVGVVGLILFFGAQAVLNN